MPPRKKTSTINRRTIINFTNPNPIPSQIEDVILEKYTKYSLGRDMKTSDLPSFWSDLRIPDIFTIGNTTLRDIAIEGTDVIDIDKLLRYSYQLVKMRDNRALIIETWNMLREEVNEHNGRGRVGEALNLVDLCKIDQGLKLNLGDQLIRDMINIGDGSFGWIRSDNKVDLEVWEVGYILGKLGEFE
ncbi:hypothetical protein WICPIJ_003448 [Wickerhamomyces pijperi]|uniref:Uncharacterized protein n=1 Tax=Wickerhamomyces pijperi TaxID=599730 RepID=A0A9P8Q7Y1_WICPI|nr:hypothetical protein WICPIJ_003448 [Wickerhamomyces pijperi]